MRKIKIITVGILSLLMVACGSGEDELSLKQEELRFELGSEVNLVKEDIVDTDDNDVLEDVVLSVDTGDEEVTEIKDNMGSVVSILNLPVGEYNANVEYEDKKIEYKLIVEDTTAPEFVDLDDEIEVQVDADGSNGEFQDLNLNAYDLSEVVVTVAMDNVDLNKVGRYETVATAKDEYGNKTEKEITIVVQERTAEE